MVVVVPQSSPSTTKVSSSSTISTNLADQQDSVALGVLIGFSLIGVAFIALALLIIWRKAKNTNSANQYVTFADSLGSRSNFHYSDLEHETAPQHSQSSPPQFGVFSMSQLDQLEEKAANPPRQGNANANANANVNTANQEFINQAFDLQENRLQSQNHLNFNSNSFNGITKSNESNL